MNKRLLLSTLAAWMLLGVSVHAEDDEPDFLYLFIGSVPPQQYYMDEEQTVVFKEEKIEVRLGEAVWEVEYEQFEKITLSVAPAEPTEVKAPKTTQSGIDIRYVNTSEGDPVATLREISGGSGYDDVVVMAPVPAVVEQADAILGFDGCLDFFSGPRNSDFSAKFNFYNVHYESHHIVGTSGGNADDMKEAIDLMAKGMDPAGLITHIGGLNTVIDTSLNLPSIPGGKKMVYTQITMPLTAIAEFEEKGKTNPVYAELDRLCKAHHGLWNAEAEAYLLSHADQL